MKSFWSEPLVPAHRRAIVVAAIVLLPVVFIPALPIWRMDMRAPQYPEGLHLVIYPNTIRGDLDKLNTLNHYVGMHAIVPNEFPEFTYLPLSLTLFGLMALMAALGNRRDVALIGWLAFTLFAVFMFRNFATWLYHYGHELDPRAALKLPAFTPPLIGYKKMANFRVWSIPGVGSYLLGAAWLLGPAIALLDVSARRAARRKAPAAALALLLLACAGPAIAATPVAPGELVPALARAARGDTLVLASGRHAGPARIDRPLVLRGVPGAVIAGTGTGSVVIVTSGGVTLEDLEVRGSGRRVLTTDSGIQVIRSANVAIRRVRLRDVLYGIYGERADSLRVERCDLEGRVPELREDGEGNGINLWYSRAPRLMNNRERGFADGVYLSFVEGAHVEGNLLERNGRYGLHTMYCQNNVLTANRFIRNTAGCAIMFSNHLEVTNNDFWRNRGPRTYGLLLRDCSDGEFRDNRLVDNTIAVFLDGSNRNAFRTNLFEDNGWGLFVFSSSAANTFAGNSFIHCDYPVALDMRRTTNQFDDGTNGNYWSDDRPYDLDGDGRGDAPYSPVSAFAFLSKQYPDLSVLARSPAVVALGVAERVLPALRPSEALDRFPRIAPVRARGTGAALARPFSRRNTAGFAAGFGGLLALGVCGFVAGRGTA
jgi:nitrous oxidase accessory protein